jgi:Tfp pilus assembly protein PilN
MSRRHVHCFLPDEFHARKTRKRSNLICGALFLTAMAGLGVGFAVSERSLRTLEAEHAAVDRQYDSAAARVLRLQRLADEEQRLARQSALAASYIDKLPRSYVVAQLTNALPPGVSLTSLEIDAAAKTPALQPPDANVRLTGVAESEVQVSLLIDKLIRSSPLSRIAPQSDSTVNQDRTPERHFSLTMWLDHKADATESPALSTTAVELAPE